MFDAIVFYSTLLLCMSLGSSYKKIESTDLKRNYGAGLGILVACLICGYNMYHTIFMVWGNVVLIKCCDKRYVHQMSMAYTWTYLLYLHINLSCTVYVMWLHQTMALRLVGLAFEINSIDGSALASEKLTLGGNDKPVEPTAVDIIAYSYFFIGLHKGPYYRWKTFQEHFDLPFGVLADCRIITEQKLKKAFFCALGCIFVELKFSSELYNQDDFYYNHGSDYRFLYNVPHLVKYFLRSQAMTKMCTSVFTETGFGVYPAKSEPVPGHGPTTANSLLKLAARKSDVALEQEYNFDMLKCFGNKKVLFGPKMKDCLQGWEMPVRYWFWTNVYNKLLRANKELRSAGSFFAWSLWSGPTVQRLMVTATLWVYIHLESEYSAIFYTTGPMKTAWYIGFYIMHVLCLIYLTPCFVISDGNTVLRYYHSMLWMYHLILFLLIAGAIVANYRRQNND